jgi:flagellar hook capping protein FlgD
MKDRYGCLGLALSLLLLTASPPTVSAQYMYIDANGDGIHTAADVMPALGTPQAVDVWLDKNHNRDGSVALCNTGSEDLSVWNSYAVHINVNSGTVDFASFTNHVTTFTIPCVTVGQAFAATQTEMAACEAGQPVFAPGPIRMFTMTITPLSGNPSLEIVRTNSLGPTFTSFGTQCFGNDFDNTYKLGTDWFDADGLASAGVAVFPARAFTTKANKVIKLGSGNPYWTIQIEPVGGSFSVGAVSLGTIRMRSVGTGSVPEIGVVLSRTSLNGDTDGNGVQEIAATFAKADLQALFSNLSGTNTVPVTFEGQITSGGIFRASANVTVNASGGMALASIVLSPLNPSGQTQFSVTKPGRVRVEMFDVSGRLVRVLADRYAESGAQTFVIDGRNGQGAPLASGIYYIRVSTAEGRSAMQRVAVLK